MGGLFLLPASSSAVLSLWVVRIGMARLPPCLPMREMQATLRMRTDADRFPQARITSCLHCPQERCESLIAPRMGTKSRIRLRLALSARGVREFDRATDGHKVAHPAD